MDSISAGQPINLDILCVKPSASIHESSYVSVVYKAFYSVGKEAFICERNRPWPESDHLTPPDEEIKNEWSYASTPPIFFYGAYGKSMPLNICVISNPTFVTSHITNLLQHFIKLFYLLRLNTHTQKTLTGRKLGNKRTSF